MDLDIEVTKVLLMGDGADARNTMRRSSSVESEADASSNGRNVRLSHQPFGLLDDSFREGHFEVHNGDTGSDSAG